MSSKSTDKEAANSTVSTDPLAADGVEAAEETRQEEAEQKAEKEVKAVKAAKTEEKKETEKTPRTRKPSVKKADRPEVKPEVYIEYQGSQILEASIVDKVKAAFVKSGHRVSSIKALQLYIKPEEAKAYYVINGGKYTGDVDLY